MNPLIKIINIVALLILPLVVIFAICLSNGQPAAARFFAGRSGWHRPTWAQGEQPEAAMVLRRDRRWSAALSWQ